MAVKITEQMYDTFINNGYTEDDIKNTVNHYRDQGMPDSAIFTNLNKRYGGYSVDGGQESFLHVP